MGKPDPEADAQFMRFKTDVLAAERSGRAPTNLIERAGTIVSFLEHAWQPEHVLDEARLWVARALNLRADDR